MTLGRLSDVYYTAAESRKRLGLTEPAFQGWVRDKKVTKIMLPNRKQGVYAKKEIEGIVASQEIAMLADQSLQLDFREATLENQYDELMLARMIYGDVTARFDEKRKELLSKVPGMTHYLYDGNFLVASLNLLPLQSEGITKFRDGERGWLLTEYAEPFAVGKPLECIIIDFLTTPRVPRNQRANYANFLLTRMAGVFAEWGKKGIEVTALYACGSTPDGTKVLGNSNFEYLGEPKPGRRMYRLDVAKAELQILKGYQRNLAKYKAKHK